MSIKNTLNRFINKKVLWKNLVLRPMIILWVSMGLSGNPFQAGLYYYAKRSMEIFDIWRSQFKAAGGDDNAERVIRVLSAQFSNPWTIPI